MITEFMEKWQLLVFLELHLCGHGIAHGDVLRQAHIHLRGIDPGKTFLCLFGLSILASFLAMAVFNTTSFDGEMFERFFEDFDEARAQRWINVGLNLFHGGVMAALIAGIWVRIKTIKA